MITEKRKEVGKMLSLILVVLVVLAIVFYNLDFEIWEGACTFLSIIVALALIVCSILLLTSFTINDEITLCEQNNVEIEQSVGECVEKYMQYEKGTFEELKPDMDYIAFAQIYPEIKTNEMVQEQIKMYQKNKQKIYDLEIKKLELRIYKFLVYFGR